MDQPIMFTPMQIWGGILAIAAAIVCLSAAAGAIGRLIDRIRKPGSQQDAELAEHEKRLDDHDESFKQYDAFFRRDKARLDRIDEGNKVVQKSLLALLSHALDDNNIDQLREAKDGLEHYLINR